MKPGEVDAKSLVQMAAFLAEVDRLRAQRGPETQSLALGGKP